MGNLPIHIYGYNNEHDVIVYNVIKDTHGECGCAFKSLCFGRFILKRNPRVFKLQQGFKKVCFRTRKCWSSVNGRRNRSKSYAF